jgi:glutamate synthase (NADPH) small chain
VLDCHQKPGGRVMNGLPGFRVNPNLIERRVELLKQRGVQFRMGVICGQDVTFGQLRKDFDAVFFGLGRADAVPLEIPGASLRGVNQAYAFVLANTALVKLDDPPVDVRGKRVVVFGGGDTAMDALRVAIRYGASEAVCLYRRDRAGLPANPEDFSNAEEEGARFQFQVQPVAILGNAAGEVASVRCVRTEPGEPAAAGKPGVQAVAGSEFDLPADVVLVAHGFAPPKLPCHGEFLELSRTSRGCLVVDDNQMTNIPGVFAGGSIVRGPAPLNEVVRDARKAAAAIDRYLAERRAPCQTPATAR